MKLKEMQKLYDSQRPSDALIERTRWAARRAQRGSGLRRTLLAAALIALLTVGTALGAGLLWPVFREMGARRPDGPVRYDALEESAVTYPSEEGMVSLLESYYDGGQLFLGVALTLPKTRVCEDFGPEDPMFSRLRRAENADLFEGIREGAGTHIVSYQLLHAVRLPGEEARFDLAILDGGDFFKGEESPDTVHAMLTFREPLPKAWRDRERLELTLTVCRIDRYAYWKGEERYFLSEQTEIPCGISILRGEGASRALSGTGVGCMAQGTASDGATALTFTIRTGQKPAEDAQTDDIVDFALYENGCIVQGGARTSAWKDGWAILWAEYAPTVQDLHAVPIYRQSGEHPEEGFDIRKTQ